MHIFNANTAHIKSRQKSKQSSGKRGTISTVKHIVHTVGTDARSRWQSIPHPSRSTFLSKHHIVSKRRKGTKVPSNILLIWRDKHDAWHRLFNHMTIIEIVIYLKLKKRIITYDDDWFLLFGDKSSYEATDLLYRVHRAKLRLKKLGV